MKTLPILLINLNGEMLYILEQRLRAQNIPAAKIKKGSLAVVAPHIVVHFSYVKFAAEYLL